MDANLEIKLYRERWKAVEDFEREELRSLSMEARLQQMIAIWRMADEDPQIRRDFEAALKGVGVPMEMPPFDYAGL